jgi:signal peptidase I
MLPPKSQIKYTVVTNGQQLDEEIMKEEYYLDIFNIDEVAPTGNPNEYTMLLTNAAKEKMIKNGIAKSITPILNAPYSVYPYDSIHRSWNEDNFGPIWIPKKGATLTLTPENYSVYERPIRVYEHNKLEMHDGKIYINDQQTSQYTFKMDYYWLMGDNRHSSQDSRFWGFVPEDHVVGEAWLIWMSYGKGIRWNRLFRTIH